MSSFTKPGSTASSGLAYRFGTSDGKRDEPVLPVSRDDTEAESTFDHLPSSATPDNSPSSVYCTRSVEEVAQTFQVNIETGLTSNSDVTLRRVRYGPNEMGSEEEDPIYIKFLQQFYENPLILILMGSAFVSFLMGNRDDAISISLAIIIVVSVGFVQEYRSEQSLKKLNELVPAEAQLTRGGHTSTVLAASLVPGDIVHFSVGDRIPADVRLVETVHLRIDESNLTGENKPAGKTSKTLTPPSMPGGGTAVIPVNGRKNIAFMGTLVREGHGTGIVIGTGENSAFGQVFRMMSAIEKPKTPLQNVMGKLSQDLSLISFIVVGLICIVGVIQGRSWLEMFTISVSLAVAAIPEGLPIVVTVTLALGVLRMARKKAIVRRLPSVETLGCVNVICSDKTGTLTQNHMSVTTIWTCERQESEPLTINTSNDYGLVTSSHTLTPSKLVHSLLTEASLCNNSKYERETGKFMGNPTDIALMEVLQRFQMTDTRKQNVRTLEVPFSSSRKWMAVNVTMASNNSSACLVKGAVERVLPACKTFTTVNSAGEIVAEPITDAFKEKVFKTADTMASKGLRILSFARGEPIKPSKNIQNSDDEFDGEVGEEENIELKNLSFMGLVGMYDPPRPTVKAAIEKLMAGGVRVIMITGDSESTALSIARQINMPIDTTHGTPVMNGDQLSALNPEQLAEAIRYVSIFARTTPEHKMIIVKALQLDNDVVAMTGDGVNDAPALKLADIGIAMGKQGTDVAKEAADMVLTDDDLSTILTAIEEGKSIFYNIQSFLAFQLSTSVAALSLIAVCTCLKLSNPLNAMQILWINILMDGPPAQSLGVEPVDHSIMKKPPRAKNEPILTKALISKILQSGIIILAGTLYVYVREMDEGVSTARDETMTFTCFVFFDMFNALACRSATKSVFELGFFSNSMFNIACGASILGQFAVIYVPFLQRVFQTEALPFKDVVFLVLFTSSVWIVDEVRKYFIRRQALSSVYPTYSYNV